MANDARFLRINLHNGAFDLRLTDPRGNIVDRAGNGRSAFAGGRRCRGGGTDCPIRDQIVHSMERVHVDCDNQGESCEPIIDGTKAAAWRTCETRPMSNERKFVQTTVVILWRLPDAPTRRTQVFFGMRIPDGVRPNNLDPALLSVRFAGVAGCFRDADNAGEAASLQVNLSLCLLYGMVCR